MRPTTAILCGIAVTLQLAGCATPSTFDGTTANSTRVKVATPRPPISAPKPPSLPQLDRRIDGTFSDTKIIDVIAYFRRELQVNIFVSWAALEAAGIEQELPITLTQRDLPASRMLDLVLRQAGAGAELEPIGFKVTGNIVNISTLRDLERHTEFRLFNIHELLTPPTDPGNASRWAKVFPFVVTNALPLMPDKEDREVVVEAVVSLVFPPHNKSDDWQAYGGPISSLREIADVLVVVGTPDGHIANTTNALQQAQLAQFQSWVTLLRDQEVATLLADANTHRLAGRTTEAEFYLSRAFDVQPDHPVALSMARMLGVKPLSPPRPIGEKPSAREPSLPPTWIAYATLPRKADHRMLAADPDALPADRTVRTRLAKRGSIAFDDTPLKQVFATIAAQAKVNIEPNWATLEFAGIEPDMPVTLALNDVPYAVILDYIIRYAGMASPLDPVDWMIHGGVVLISSEREFYRHVHTRRYNIESLIQLILFTHQFHAASDKQSSPPVADSDRGDTAGEENPSPRENAIEQIVSLILDSVGRQENWEAYGGEFNRIRLTGKDTLIITANTSDHLVLDQLLGSLRDALSLNVDAMLTSQRTDPMFAEAQKHRLEQRHDEALKAINKLLAIRPDHLRALAMKTVIEQTQARRMLRLRLKP